MTLLLIIIVGGLIGWIASKVMGTDPEQGILLNIVVGIIGALLGGFLFSWLFSETTILSGDFSIGSLLISLLGAIVLLAIVKAVRGTSRRRT